MLLTGLLAWQGVAPAQNTGSIGGTVTDSGGAAVSGAAVVLTNSGTKESRQQSSNSEGYFTFNNLLPGVYAIRISVSGFSQLAMDDVELTVGQARRVNPRLQLATVQTSVEVEATAAPVVTSNASLSELVDERRIEDLPLNGRNALQMVNLVSGAISTGTTGQYGAVQTVFNVSGGRDVDQTFTLDGGIHVNAFYDNAVEYPNPDALEEFSVNSRSYSAAFGRGTTSVNAVTKSGTNDYHGDVFEFLRNTDLDARSFFAATRSPFQRNQYGGVFGGPIRKDRLFFFIAYQGTNQVGAPGVTTYQTLTGLERTGNFSDISKTIKDPTTGAAFPGNIIPASRIDPFATAFLQQMLPPPNSGTNFYQFTPLSKMDQNEVTSKIDYLVTSKDHVWFRYYLDNVPQTNGTSLEAADLTNFPTRFQSWNAGYTRTLSPAMVNELRVTYVRSYFAVYPEKPWSLQSLGMNLPPANLTTAYGLSSEATITASSYFTGNFGAPTRDISPSGQLSDSLSWSKGIHQITIGFDLYKNRMNEIQNYETGGAIAYNGQVTGNAAADFMIGRFSSLTQDSGFALRLHQTLPAAYLQDDVRLTRRLTLNVGLRWDPFRPFSSEGNQLVTFSPGVESTVYPNAPAGLLYPGDAGVPQTVIPAHWMTFAPRMGIAWDVFGNGRTAIRAGGGIFYIPLDRSQTYNNFGVDQPFSASVTVSGGNTQSIFAGAPFNGADPLIRTYSSDPAQLATVPFLPTANESVLVRPFKTQMDHQRSFTVSQAIGAHNTLEVSYVGSSAEHLYTSFEVNPAVYIPGASSTSNTQQRRLDPAIGAMNGIASALSSNYNSLQVSFNRHYANGVTLLSSYTWSKALGVTGAEKQGSNGPRDPFDRQLDYGPLNFDIAGNFKASFIWDVPLARAAHSGVLRVVAAGWQVSGIVTSQTGLPFTIVSCVDNSFSGIGADTAYQVGPWQLPGNRSQAAKIQAWFNPKAFTANPVGTFGDVGSNSMRAPGMFDVDLSIDKTFTIAERFHLDLRGSFYNATNHTVLSAPNASENSSTFGVITASGNPRVAEVAAKLRF
jgi:hypothetical protein